MNQRKIWTSENIILFIAIVVFVFFLVQIVIQTGFSFTIDFLLASDFGKAIGGILSFISIVFLYVGMKKQANVFLVNQFENKYYEQIKYHRANVESLEYKTPNTQDLKDPWMIRKNLVFVEIFDEMLEAKGIVYNLLKNEDIEGVYLDSTDDNLHNFNERKIDLLQVAILDISYLIVYFGVSKRSLPVLKKFLNNKYQPVLIQSIIDKFLKIPVKYSKYRKNYIKGEPIPRKARYVKFFGGHQHRIGHYFRHFFQSIDFLNKSDEQLKFDYNTKYDYAKKFRAQLSTYEQAVLFFNSISELGRSWELTNSDIDNHLITKYNLIKNLPEGFIPDVVISNFYPDVKYEGKSNTQNKLELIKKYK